MKRKGTYKKKLYTTVTTTVMDTSFTININHRC